MLDASRGVANIHKSVSNTLYGFVVTRALSDMPLDRSEGGGGDRTIFRAMWPGSGECASFGDWGQGRAVICNGIYRNAGQAACPHPEFRSLFGLLDFIPIIPWFIELVHMTTYRITLVLD